MKIQSLSALSSHTLKSHTSKGSHSYPKAVDHDKLTALWSTSVSGLNLQQALTQLIADDPRNELTVKAQNSVRLTTWLGEHFEALMTVHADFTGLGKAVCASLWHKQLVELLMPTLVALRFQYRLVPADGLLAIGLDIEPNGRINTISIPEGTVDKENELALDSAFKTIIAQFAESLQPLFADQRVNSKRFWGNLSNALAQGFTRLAPRDSQPFTQADCDQINLWLAQVLPPEASLVEVKLAQSHSRSMFYVRRKTCCLKYKLDKVRMCQTCNLKQLSEQEKFYTNKLVNA
ncbi:IucA/IucC family C-terminal-domain containing protein [Vibrio hippocampi]|uniref:Siderophore-iron reductase FhuF n=1 Tax=Vibrio hippocampi TaxID=654686 RepID=A0ABN8DNJ5_9VIBR|nr:IucA/IucC family C-terminal-domain containing protein [Vibrio hippocampi]CAH0528916.1 hypothetical protein VHP8226_02946 [Vibrio hippocampi]